MTTYDDEHRPHAAAESCAPADDAGGAERSGNAVRSDVLLAGRKELIIQHGAEFYRLRLTGNNKLILTK